MTLIQYIRKYQILLLMYNSKEMTTAKDRLTELYKKQENEQEAHGPHRSPEKPVQINKHFCSNL